MVEGLDSGTIATKRVALDGISFQLDVSRDDAGTHVLVTAVDKHPDQVASRSIVSFMMTPDD